MTLKRTRAVARKEFRHILRDPRSLIMALALPALMLLLFGWALSLDVDRLPTQVLDHDESPASRELIARFEGSRFFALRPPARDLKDLEGSLAEGNTLVGLVIPERFAEALELGQPLKVQVLLDGSDSNTASIALGYVQATVSAYSEARAAGLQERRLGGSRPAPIDLRSRVLYNNQLQSKNFIVPGLVAVILTIIAALLTSLTIAREKEMGSLELLISTPVRPAEIILGKMSAYFALGVVDTIVAIGVGVFFFEVPFRGSLLLLGLSCFIFLFGALCWGILLSASARNQLVAYQLGMITSFLPAFLLSGFVFAIENMPVAIQVPTLIVPARYFITVLRGIFLKGVGLEFLAVELLLLVIYSSLVFLAALRRLNFRKVL